MLTSRFCRLFLIFQLASGPLAWAQSLDVSISGNSNVDFSFTTIQKLTSGIVIPNAFTVNVEAIGTNWDLYMGAVTTVAGTWDNAQYYATSGNGAPPVSLLQARVHNLSRTPQISGYVPLQDIAVSTLDIIGNHLANPDPSVSCGDASPVGTNTPGSFTTDPQCYQFRVDLKVVPGMNYRPGLYTMQIEFILAPDL